MSVTGANLPTATIRGGYELLYGKIMFPVASYATSNCLDVLRLPVINTSSRALQLMAGGVVNQHGWRSRDKFLCGCGLRVLPTFVDDLDAVAI